MSRDRLSLIVFVAIAFGVPWTGWTLLQALKLDWGSPAGYALFSTGLACSLGGLIAVLVGEGWRGVGDRLKQAVRVRAPIQWWLLALFLPLGLALVSGWTYLALHGGSMAPDWTITRNWLTVAALMIFVPGPLGEEFGWRGYLLPRFQRHTSFWVSAVAVGLIWGVWHLPLYWGRVMADGWVWFGLFCAGVCAFSVLISAVWARTRSLLLAMVMHFTINLTQNWTFFPQISAEGRISQLVTFVVVSWIAALMVVLIGRPDRARNEPAKAMPLGN